ncbi:MAG: transposase [bacterium]
MTAPEQSRGSGVPPLLPAAPGRLCHPAASSQQGAQGGSGIPPLLPAEPGRLCHSESFLCSYFDPAAPVAFLSGDLPHWRQAGTTYFVTFRLADSLPQEKLAQWRNERGLWLKAHPEPHDEATRLEYYERFPQRLQHWLDAGAGACLLASSEVRELMAGVLRYFDGKRYTLGAFVVAPNHVHVLVTPHGEHLLSEILHTWMSFSAHEIGKQIKTEPGRLGLPGSLRFWQKETFDHIVRSPASLEKIRAYIRNQQGVQGGSGVPPLRSPV